jgi:hypothetical protein
MLRLDAIVHFVNAYEQDNEVVFESMRYPNADIFNAFTEVMRGRSNKFTEAYPYLFCQLLSIRKILLFSCLIIIYCYRIVKKFTSLL